MSPRWTHDCASASYSTSRSRFPARERVQVLVIATRHSLPQRPGIFARWSSRVVRFSAAPRASNERRPARRVFAIAIRRSRHRRCPFTRARTSSRSDRARLDRARPTSTPVARARACVARRRAIVGSPASPNANPMLLFLSRAGRGDGERFRPNARFFEEIARSSLARASRRRSRPDPARSHVTFYASYWRSVRPRALNGLPYTLLCLMVTHLLIFCASRNFSPRPSLDEVLKHRNATDEVPNPPLEDSL